METSLVSCRVWRCNSILYTRIVGLCFLLIPSGLVCLAGVACTLPVVPPEGIVGKLLIGGGGRLPDSVIKSFVQNVPEPKNVVLIGTASQDPHQAEKRAMEWLAENGLTGSETAH
jgi:hypothetical protein